MHEAGQGLPLMSSDLESVIKRVNVQVKGWEMFWSDGGGGDSAAAGG
jgi:hypothetical protein